MKTSHSISYFAVECTIYYHYVNDLYYIVGVLCLMNSALNGHLSKQKMSFLLKLDCSKSYIKCCSHIIFIFFATGKGGLNLKRHTIIVNTEKSVV